MSDLGRGLRRPRAGAAWWTYAIASDGRCWDQVPEVGRFGIVRVGGLVRMRWNDDDHVTGSVSGRTIRGMGRVRVVGLDHIVLNVADVRRSLAFYVEELGLEPLRVAEWERGEVFFPSVRVDGSTIIDLLVSDRSGVNVDHFCLVVADVDLTALAASGAFEVLDGPDQRWGAQGMGTSLYVRDPDGNTVELRTYG